VAIQVHDPSWFSFAEIEIAIYEDERIYPPVMLQRPKSIVWRSKNSAKLQVRKGKPFGPAARTKVWSCFFVTGDGGGGGGGGERERETSERGERGLQIGVERGRERLANCNSLLEVNMESKEGVEGGREGEMHTHTFPPAEFERHSPTIPKSVGHGFRTNA
jgi:hypothetical protein